MVLHSDMSVIGITRSGRYVCGWWTNMFEHAIHTEHQKQGIATANAKANMIKQGKNYGEVNVVLFLVRYKLCFGKWSSPQQNAKSKWETSGDLKIVLQAWPFSILKYRPMLYLLLKMQRPEIISPKKNPKICMVLRIILMT